MSIRKLPGCVGRVHSPPDLQITACDHQLLCCGTWPSHCHGFSCCRAWALEHGLVGACGLSFPTALGTPQHLGPGIKTMFPAFTGEFFTTESPGKSHTFSFTVVGKAKFPFCPNQPTFQYPPPPPSSTLPSSTLPKTLTTPVIYETLPNQSWVTENTQQ